ncbi:unnamed protein product [Phytophthora fragariaefolia]|uniref:Unnamed protein product n=1 Tax=Phytophthora fragariaefolia TaxID=1490495 RepID=A0A9W7D1E6_9STRA|nr:unnamed protein product [Phytophthora fragariaefolia]
MIASNSRPASLHTPRSFASSESTWSRATDRALVSGGASPASASAIPVAFVTFLEELGALQLVIPPPPATSELQRVLGRHLQLPQGPLTELVPRDVYVGGLDSDGSGDSGPIVPSALHKGNGKRPAKSSAKLQSAPPTPKKKQRLGRPSVDLKARKAAKQAASDPVHDKELLAMKYALVKFRVHLLGQKPFVIYTDHASLRTATSPPHLSQRMARWLSFFTEYNFTVEYMPGKQNVLPDALSRRPDYELARLAYLESPLYELIRKAYADDDDLAESLGVPTKPVELTARQRSRLHRYSSVPSSLSAASLPTSSAPISGIAVSADSDVLSFASIPSGSDPPFSPIPRTPASPASSTASTASLPSTPVVSRGITPGTEASIPVEIDDDGGLGADEAASDASVAVLVAGGLPASA